MISSVFAVFYALAVTVTGKPSCPDTLAVHAALAKLNGDIDAMSGEMRIAADETVMRVEVLGPDGSALAEKTFAGQQSCAERAQVAAVFASTWLAASAVPSAMQDVQVTEIPPAEVEKRAEPLPGIARDPAALRLGVSGFGIAGAQFQDPPSWGLAGDITYRPTPSWGGRAEVFGVYPRSVDIGLGEARFRRLGIGVGGLMRSPGRWGALVADGGFLFARTSVNGSGFAMNTGAQSYRQTYEKAVDASPTCAGCHVPLDPVGYALDVFDVVGRLRTG